VSEPSSQAFFADAAPHSKELLTSGQPVRLPLFVKDRSAGTHTGSRFVQLEIGSQYQTLLSCPMTTTLISMECSNLRRESAKADVACCQPWLEFCLIFQAARGVEKMVASSPSYPSHSAHSLAPTIAARAWQPAICARASTLLLQAMPFASSCGAMSSSSSPEVQGLLLLREVRAPSRTGAGTLRDAFRCIARESSSSAVQHRAAALTVYVSAKRGADDESHASRASLVLAPSSSSPCVMSAEKQYRESVAAAAVATTIDSAIMMRVAFTIMIPLSVIAPPEHRPMMLHSSGTACVVPVIAGGDASIAHGARVAVPAVGTAVCGMHTGGGSGVAALITTVVAVSAAAITEVQACDGASLHHAVVAQSCFVSQQVALSAPCMRSAMLLEGFGVAMMVGATVAGSSSGMLSAVLDAAETRMLMTAHSRSYNASVAAATAAAFSRVFRFSDTYGRFAYGECAHITGGMGMIGSLSATWIAQQSCAKVVALGRSGRGGATATSTTTMLASCAMIVARCDVPVSEELSFSTSAATNILPRALVHSGGCISDALAVNQTAHRVSAALAPKVPPLLHMRYGVPHHGMVRAVVFSSIAVLLANPGQSNYVAANSGLNAWVGACAQSAAVQASAIQWGGWAEGGMAGGDNKAVIERAEMSGLGVIRIEEGIRALQSVCGRGYGIFGAAATPVTCSPMVWPRFTSTFFTSMSSSAATVVAGTTSAQGTAVAPASAGTVQAQLSAGPREITTQGAILAWIQSVLEDLGCNDFDPEVAFTSMGMDSLANFEFQDKLRAAFSGTPDFITIKFPTPLALGKLLLSMNGVTEGDCSGGVADDEPSQQDAQDDVVVSEVLDRFELVHVKRGYTSLTVAFGGKGGAIAGMAMTRDGEFFSMLAPTKTDILLAKDLDCTNYVREHATLSPHIIAKFAPYKEVKLIGNSMGGFAALLYSSCATHCYAISPAPVYPPALFMPKGTLLDWVLTRLKLHQKLRQAYNDLEKKFMGISAVIPPWVALRIQLAAQNPRTRIDIGVKDPRCMEMYFRNLEPLCKANVRARENVVLLEGMNHTTTVTRRAQNGELREAILHALELDPIDS